MPVAVWLSSWSRVSFHGGRIVRDLAVEAGTPEIVNQLPNEELDKDLEESVFGMVVLDAPEIMHCMRIVGPHVHEQKRFWQNMLDEAMDGNSFTFHVSRSVKFQQPVPLRRYVSRHRRGPVLPMDAPLVEQLMALLHPRPTWLPAVAPQTLIRLPLPYCILVVNKRWQDILLPHTQGIESIPYRARLALNFQALGFQPDMIPRMPQELARVDDDGDRVLLDKNMLTSIADEFKDVVARVRVEQSFEDDFAQDRYAALVAHVRALDKMVSDLDPVAFLKVTRNARHMANASRNGHGLPYKVTFVVEAVMLANLLHDAGTMHKVLHRAAVLALPPALRNDVAQLFDDMQKIVVVPHKATVSRWRFLLDGAFMLWQRRHQAVGGHVRFMMADSSSQHSREFEHVVIRSLLRSKLLELFDAATNLVRIRHASL